MNLFLNLEPLYRQGSPVGYMAIVVMNTLETETTGRKRHLLASLKDYQAGILSYEQVVLIGIYSALLSRTEEQTREYMGLPGMKSSEAANEKQYGKKRKSPETSRIYDENY